MTQKEVLYAYLTSEERERFLVNAKNDVCDFNMDDTIMETNHSLVIVFAFSWSCTPEGNPYWLDITQRIERGERIQLPLEPRKDILTHKIL